jgi:hypothetical protein
MSALRLKGSIEMNGEGQSGVSDRLKELILVRLLSAGKPPAQSDMDKALRRYVAEQFAMPTAQWQESLGGALEELHDEGSILKKPFQLTEEGRTAALSVLGVVSLPASVTWQTLRNRYLIAKALGIEPQSKAEWDHLSSAEGLRAAVLAKHHQLPLGPVPSLARALHALAWMQLRRSHDVVLPLENDFTRNSVLSVILLEGRPSKKPEEVLAARATGASSPHPDKVREAVLCKWVRESDQGTVPIPFDLGAFATRVRQLACSATTGRFGEYKVFISHVWNRFRREGFAAGMTRHDFDRHLVEANRENLLTLSRADLVSGMNPDDVQQSEIKLPHSSFHFIRTDQ